MLVCSDICKSPIYIEYYRPNYWCKFTLSVFVKRREIRCIKSLYCDVYLRLISIVTLKQYIYILF